MEFAFKYLAINKFTIFKHNNRSVARIWPLLPMCVWLPQIFGNRLYC